MLRIQTGATRSVAHAAFCRDRIMRLVDQDDEDRMLWFFEQVKDRDEQKGKKTGGGETQRGVTHPFPLPSKN